MSAARASSPVFTVLFVCTGNVCRSALAERLARAYLTEALGDHGGAAVRLASAGTRAVVGAGMHPDTALVLRGLGGDPDGFVARQLHEGLVAAADLVLTMTRRHRDAVLAIAPRALPRAFLLREAADLAGGAGGTEPTVDEPAERARALVAGMAGARGRRPAGRDDVVDPIGRPLDVQARVGETVAGALLPVFSRIATAVAPAGDGRRP